MKFKWRYTMIPACISFGPFFMSNMGGLGNHGWAMPMLGTIMVTIGLGTMLSVLAEHRKVIDELLKQQGRAHSANT
jgi:hypothetical protein